MDLASKNTWSYIFCEYCGNILILIIAILSRRSLYSLLEVGQKVRVRFGCAILGRALFVWLFQIFITILRVTFYLFQDFVENIPTVTVVPFMWQFKKMNSTRTTTEESCGKACGKYITSHRSSMWGNTQTHTNIFAHEINLLLCARYNVTAMQLRCSEVGIMYFISVRTLLSVDRGTHLSKLCWNPKSLNTRSDRPGCFEIKARIIISHVTENFISINIIFSCTHSSGLCTLLWHCTSRTSWEIWEVCFCFFVRLSVCDLSSQMRFSGEAWASQPYFLKEVVISQESASHTLHTVSRGAFVLSTRIRQRSLWLRMTMIVI